MPTTTQAPESKPAKRRFISRTPKPKKKDVKPTGKYYLEIVPGVDGDGYARPGAQVENQQKYGWEDPRHQYIYGGATTSEISQTWQVSPGRVTSWIKVGGWEEKRKAYRESLQTQLHRVYNTETVQKMREAWVTQRVEISQQIIHKALERLEEGTEEAVMATGKVKKIQMKGSSIKHLSNVITEQMENISVALGVPVKVVAPAGSTNLTQINTIVIERPVDGKSQATATMTEQPVEPALPSGETIEAEVDG